MDGRESQDGREQVPELDLHDAVVVVTGATSGIGEAIARALQAAGAHPVLPGRREDRLAALSAQLDGGPRKVPLDPLSSSGNFRRSQGTTACTVSLIISSRARSVSCGCAAKKTSI